MRSLSSAAMGRRTRPGDVRFVRKALGVLLEGEYASPTMRVEVPGQGDLRAATVFVANCSPWSFAGPVPLDVAPDVSFGGGFEIVVESVEACSAPGRFTSLLRKEDDDDGRGLHNLERATVRCERPLPVKVDAELLGDFDVIELGVVRDAARQVV